MRQLMFPFHLDENSLKSYLENATRRAVSIIITDNSTSMLSIKEKNNSVFLRLHRIFLTAGKEVLDELSDYIKGKKRKTPLIRKHINNNIHQLRKKTRRKVNIVTRGKRFDLLDIFHCINKDYFAGSVSASITWGAKGPRRAARRRTLGSYATRNRMIRINPILDSRSVPRYFLEFIVYHEMLHADIGIKKSAGRRIIHSGEFKRREKLFKHYEKALDWERKRW